MLFIISQVSNIGYIQEIPEYIGQMPTIVVTAPHYKNEVTSSFKFLPGIPMNFAFGQSMIHHLNIPIKSTFAEDLYVPEEDTIDEDVMVSGGNAKIDGVIDGDLAVMGGVVEINGIVDGDVAVMGGNLELNGSITGDAAVFGGNVVNKGTIELDVLVVGGTVMLDSGSVVQGDVNMVGGTVERDDNAVVEGEIQSVEIGKAFRVPRVIPGHRVFHRIFLIAFFFVFYLIGLLAFLIFPGAIEHIIGIVKANVWASVGLGIAVEVLYIPIILLFTISIIGIPLIPLFMLAVLLAALFGFSALCFIIGERVIEGMKWQIENKAGIFSLGWLATAIIPLILFLIGPPVVVFGVVILYVVATIGMGAVALTLLKTKKKKK